MARVYILVNVMPGRDRGIRDTLRGIKGVSMADVVTGHYDIVAVLEANTMSDVFDNILKKVRAIKGINRTETFMAVE
jgi:DNA-binding Lrp family transcriptional regulator